MPKQASVELLKDFLNAFNRHDLDSIMDYFADACVFYMPPGAAPRAERYIAKADVCLEAGKAGFRESRMYIMGRISTGPVAISVSLNGR